jgi:photosystem II stability/assembly factor-like uncharacterized protein/Tfp pilus assembly protein PilX
MIRQKTQQGYLLIIAIILIVIISAFAAAIMYMFGGTAAASFRYHAAKQAFYLAESGLEQSFQELLNPANSCNAINNLTTTFGSGVFKINSTYYAPTPATLSSAIDATAIIIPLSSAAGFASQGQVNINQEAIDYNDISGNQLIGVHRGASGTTPTSHSAGSLVKQDLCDLIAEGAVPNFSNPSGDQTVRASIAKRLNEAWAVGEDGVIYRLYGNTWTAYDTSPTTENLNSVSLLPNGALGFAVGNNGTILRFDGTRWFSDPDSGIVSKDLNDVFTVSNIMAVAVGDQGTILEWNGSNWNIDSSPTHKNLNAVSFARDGSLVGFIVGDTGTILQYQAGIWVQVTSPTIKDLSDVDVVSGSEAWAVGGHEAGQPPLIVWKGGNWQGEPLAIEDEKSYYAISMLDTNHDGHADAGCAVGQAGHLICYDGTFWQSHTAGGTMVGLVLFSPNEAWAVGQGNNELTHWDSSGWTDYSPSLPPLTAIDKTDGNARFIKVMWSEKYN